MLTKSDLDAIGKLIDKKLSTDIAAIQARVADIEDAQVRKIDILELRSMIRSVDKRVAAVEGRLLKSLTKDDLQHLATKDDLKNFATKDDLKSFPTKDDLQKELKPLNKNINKLRKDLKAFTRFFDSEHIDLVKRVDKLDKKIFPVITSS